MTTGHRSGVNLIITHITSLLAELDAGNLFANYTIKQFSKFLCFHIWYPNIRNKLLTYFRTWTIAAQRLTKPDSLKQHLLHVWKKKAQRHLQVSAEVLSWHFRAKGALHLALLQNCFLAIRDSDIPSTNLLITQWHRISASFLWSYW